MDVEYGIEGCSDRSDELEAGFVWIKRREDVIFKIVNVDGFERTVLNDSALSCRTNV